MDWRLGGAIPVMHTDGPDVSRSAAARAAAEAIWVPTSLLPRFGVTWTAEADDQITASYRCGTEPVEVHHRIGADGRLREVLFDRWGDPDDTGRWGPVPFGGVITAHRTFGPVTIPSAGEFGWRFGTDRWPDSALFRYEITRLALTP